MLKRDLPSELSYHNYEHTLDVIEAAERIALSENISPNELLVLKTAAAFHDVGYIDSRIGHEERSCEIAKEKLTSHGMEKAFIDQVCDLILATKVPHTPQNKLSEIICDADLDYLGRDDYFSISKNVFSEFKLFGIVKNENDWREVQIKFLESHKYFTPTAIRTREMKKEENLSKIRSGI